MTRLVVYLGQKVVAAPAPSAGLKVYGAGTNGLTRDLQRGVTITPKTLGGD